MKIKLTKPVKGRYFTFIILLADSVLSIDDRSAQKMIAEGKAEGLQGENVAPKPVTVDGKKAVVVDSKGVASTAPKSEHEKASKK